MMGCIKEPMRPSKRPQSGPAATAGAAVVNSAVVAAAVAAWNGRRELSSDEDMRSARVTGVADGLTTNADADDERSNVALRRIVVNLMVGVLKGIASVLFMDCRKFWQYRTRTFKCFANVRGSWRSIISSFDFLFPSDDSKSRHSL